MNDLEPKPKPAEPATGGKEFRMSWAEQTFWICVCPLASVSVGFVECMWHAASPDGGGPEWAILMIQANFALIVAIIGFIACLFRPGIAVLGWVFALHTAGSVIMGAMYVLDRKYWDIAFFVVPALATGALAYLCFQSSENKTEESTEKTKQELDESRTNPRDLA